MHRHLYSNAWIQNSKSIWSVTLISWLELPLHVKDPRFLSCVHLFVYLLVCILWGYSPVSVVSSMLIYILYDLEISSGHAWSSSFVPAIRSISVHRRLHTGRPPIDSDIPVIKFLQHDIFYINVKKYQWQNESLLNSNHGSEKLSHVTYL